MYYSPTIRYEACLTNLKKQYKTGLCISFTLGGSIGVLAGYLLKTLGG